ncbi:MAG: hypothetical protein AAGB29_00860 [Planctomycetota bacterium]
MYTVKCPSCSFAIELPFARRGAAGRCPACNKVVPVDDSTLEVSGPARAPVAAPTPKIDPETPNVDAEGNVIGLSGLSNLLERAEPSPAKRDAPKPTLRPRAKPRPPAAVPRGMLLAVVVAVGTVALMGLAIWYITVPSHGTSRSAPPVDTDATAPVETPPPGTPVDPVLD